MSDRREYECDVCHLDTLLDPVEDFRAPGSSVLVCSACTDCAEEMGPIAKLKTVLGVEPRQETLEHVSFWIETLCDVLGGVRAELKMLRSAYDCTASGHVLSTSGQWCVACQTWDDLESDREKRNQQR